MRSASAVETVSTACHIKMHNSHVFRILSISNIGSQAAIGYLNSIACGKMQLTACKRDPVSESHDTGEVEAEQQS